MGDTFDWWWGGGDWYDLKQKRRIEELESTQAASEHALRSRLRQADKQTSDLGTRLGQLEAAIVALVELEDTREGLNAHADDAATRRYAREVVGLLPTMGGRPGSTAPSPPPDVPGYWLHPAMRALAAEVHPGTDDVEALLAEARHRDAVQTDLCVVCLAGLAATPERAHDVLSRVVPGSDNVTAAQRVVWGVVADGRFGERERRRLADTLASVIGAAPSVAVAGAGEVAEGSADGGAQIKAEVARLATGRSGSPDSPLEAARRLGTLRAWVDAITEDVGAVPDGTDADTTNAALAAPTGEPLAEIPAPTDDPLAELLAHLVTQGAPGESAILARMVQIRTALSDVGVPTISGTPPPTDEAAGSARQLLLADLADTSASSRVRRRLALAVVAPHVTALADDLHAAGHAEPPREAVVKLPTAGGLDVVVGPDGPTTTSWAKQIDVDAIAPAPPSSARPTAIALGVVAVIGFVLGLAVAPAWFALAAAAALAAGGLAVWFVKETADRTRELSAATAAAQRLIDNSANSLRTTIADVEAAAPVVEDDRQAIGVALTEV